MNQFKKNVLKTFVFLPITFVLCSCEGKYKEKNGKMYYCYWHAEAKAEKLVEKADLSTFETFVKNKRFAKDKVYVYYMGDIIVDANTKKFQVLNDGYYGDDYSKDDKHVFHEAKILEGIDPITFQTLDDLYAKDKNSVFFEGKCLPEADAKTFATIGHYIIMPKMIIMYIKKAIFRKKLQTQKHFAY
jgi:hypothetical protein